MSPQATCQTFFQSKAEISICPISCSFIYVSKYARARVQDKDLRRAREFFNMSRGTYRENFLEGAESNIRLGKDALSKGSFVDAFIRSFWTLENSLKAVLVKSRNYDNRGSGDRHHRCLDLLSKIQNLGIIPPNIIAQVTSHANSLLTINVYDSSGHCHMDSPPPTSHFVINDIRYFDASKYLGLNDSRSKIQEAESIYNLLKPFM